MTVKEFFSKHTITIVIVISIVLTGMSINWVCRASEEAIVESTYNQVNEIGIQYENLLEGTITQTRENLSLLAYEMAEYNIEDADIMAFLHNRYQCEEYENLYYVDIEGNGLSLDNKQYDFSENQSFIHAVENQSDSTHSIISKTSEISFGLAMPVVKDNEVSAVLFCEISTEGFLNIISDTKNYIGDIIFFDTDMNMLFATGDSYLEGETVSGDFITAIGSDNIHKAHEDILNNVDGGFSYDYFGESKIMVYHLIDMTDMAFAIDAYVSSLSSEIITSYTYNEIVMKIVYWVTIFLVIYISVNNNKHNKSIEKVAYYDALTNLPNSVKLSKDIIYTLDKNKKTKYSIIVFDIENFKAINEMFGHEVGDRVLVSVKLFAYSLNIPNLIIARIAGDKFAMFGPSKFLSNLDMLTGRLADNLGKYVPELNHYGGSYKIGRYEIEEDDNFDSIMAKVNIALTKAKSSKNLIICDYNGEFKKKLLKEADITNKMRNALEDDEFKVYLQPKFSVHNNKLIGAEALVRWIAADGTMVYPSDFIPLFERNGFIVDIDRYVLENVCKTIRKWMDNGIGPVAISVNCSRLSAENPDYINEITTIAAKYQVPHKYIEIELTESATISNFNMIEELFLGLHKKGFKVSVDDFGAGYSSLGMLKNLHVDTLKMDRSFFVGGKNKRRDDMLIDSIIRMSHNLGMYVVAEGIETQEQINLLESLNCDAVQGYFYAKPMSILDFENEYSQQIKDNNLSVEGANCIIKDVIDSRFAVKFAERGLIVTEANDDFTILEANDYYFKLVGYTREEVRDNFDNKAVKLMDSQSHSEIIEYLKSHIKEDGKREFSLNASFTMKNGKTSSYRLNGRICDSDQGGYKLCCYISDGTEENIRNLYM